MRKPRDYDAELGALTDKAKLLKQRKVRQLGELVIATGADVLTIEQLAGLLTAGMESESADARENWRRRGAAFFQRAPSAGDGAGLETGGAAPGDSKLQADGG